MSTADDSALSPGRLAVAALAVVALWLALAGGDALAGLSPALDAVVGRAGTDYVVAAALGVLALLAGLGVFLSGRGATTRRTEMPTVERPIPVPAAGEPFDERIAGWRFAAPVVGREPRSEVRERLRAAAVAAVAAAEDCSRAEARRRVDAGTWTGDAHAAAFLAGRRPSLATWLTALSRGESAPAFRARRTVGAIATRSASDRASGDGARGEAFDHRATDGGRRE